MFILPNIAKQTTLESVQTTNSQKSLLWDLLLTTELNLT